MKDRDEILRRLFRAATIPSEAPAQMPFGFDTRVLALSRQPASNGSATIALFARRASALAATVIILAIGGLYIASTSETNADVTNEYSIADKAIQNNLGE